MIKKLNLFSLTFFYCLILVGCAKDNDIFDLAIQQDIDENIVAEENNEPEETEEEPDATEEEPDTTEEDLPGLEDKYNGVLKAFPSAEGHGQNATGGRGGKVLFVTNLNDSGPGSLRQALEERGARNIIVRVAGYIDLQSDLSISNGNMTFEGNTAPGDGIILRGHSLIISSPNVIMRNMIHAVGSSGTPDSDDGLRIFGFGSGRTKDIIVDHSSFHFDMDEGISVTDASRVTVQYCTTSNTQDSGAILVGNSDYPTFQTSVLNNGVFWSKARNPRFSELGDGEYVNNYHFGYRTPAQVSYGSEFDMIGNVWENDTDGFDSRTLDAVDNGEPPSTTVAYVKDNLLLGGTFTIDNHFLTYSSSNATQSNGYVARPASEVKSHILENVGARRAIGLNALDERMIQDVLNGVRSNYDTAPYDYPDLNDAPPYLDQDNDGMDDEWEVSVFGNTDQTSSGDFNENGYTNLEEFFFYLNKE